MPRKIEEVINDVLKGDTQKNAMELVAYLRAKEFAISTLDEKDADTWSGFDVADLCYVNVNGSDQFPGPWTVWIAANNLGQHSEGLADECVKEFAWSHVSPCGSCGGKCSPGTHTTVFGRDFENVCSHNLIFINPDAKTVEGMKKIVDIRKNDILKNG